MVLKKLFTFFLLILIVLSSVSCLNQKNGLFGKKELKVALILSGPINDTSWNSAAYNGLKRFKEDYKAKIAVVEKVTPEDARDIASELAERKFDLIIGHGYEYAPILKSIAKKFPETFFCVISGEVSQEPNLCSFNFKDEQYGYLIGLAAGLNTATNKVGIVVGKKIPSIERAILGMRKGLKKVNPKVDLVVSYIDTWNSIEKGREAGTAQIDLGVDVITHLADASGIGVIKAAEDAEISAIGAISDQHDLAPSTVITSGIEDVSHLIYSACEYLAENSLQPRIYRFGLKDQVIDLAPSYGNIDPGVESKIDRIKDELVELEESKGK